MAGLTKRHGRVMVLLVTVADMLARVRGYTRAGRWMVDRHHCVPRMRQRHIQMRDIEHGLLAGTECHLQENGRWKLGTTDCDGDPLVLILHVDDGILVVTVF